MYSMRQQPRPQLLTVRLHRTNLDTELLLLRRIACASESGLKLGERVADDLCAELREDVNGGDGAAVCVGEGEG